MVHNCGSRGIVIRPFLTRIGSFDGLQYFCILPHRSRRVETSDGVVSILGWRWHPMVQVLYSSLSLSSWKLSCFLVYDPSSFVNCMLFFILLTIIRFPIRSHPMFFKILLNKCSLPLLIESGSRIHFTTQFWP